MTIGTTTGTYSVKITRGRAADTFVSSAPTAWAAFVAAAGEVAATLPRQRAGLSSGLRTAGAAVAIEVSAR